jgi:hypothetical protein
MSKLFLWGILLLNITSQKDMIVLTTDESIEGHLVSADENVVRFRDTRGIVEEIPRDKVSTIRFTTAATASYQFPPAPPNQATSAAPEEPEEQRQFCSIVTAFQKEQMAYMQEVNPIRKAVMRVPDPYRYEAQVRDLFGPKHEFVNWTGTLRFGTLGRSIGIVFTPTCVPPQMIQFGNAVEQPGVVADNSAGTVIRADSPIGRTVAGAKSAEQAAIVSGTLIPVPGFSLTFAVRQVQRA